MVRVGVRVRIAVRVRIVVRVRIAVRVRIVVRVGVRLISVSELNQSCHNVSKFLADLARILTVLIFLYVN